MTGRVVRKRILDFSNLRVVYDRLDHNSQTHRLDKLFVTIDINQTLVVDFHWLYLLDEITSRRQQSSKDVNHTTLLDCSIGPSGMHTVIIGIYWHINNNRSWQTVLHKKGFTPSNTSTAGQVYWHHIFTIALEKLPETAPEQCSLYVVICCVQQFFLVRQTFY